MDDDHESFNFQSHMNSFDQEEFLKDIIQQPVSSPETESETPSAAPIVDCRGEYGTLLKSSRSSNSIISTEKHTSSPTAYIWSFDNSIVEPAKTKGYTKHDSALETSKRKLGSLSFEPREHQATNKARNSSETQDHIMAERKRRQELTGNIIALSATIPGLKKADKAYVLREAVIYMKQLQERIRELENRNRKRCAGSMIVTKKSQFCTKEATTSRQTNSDRCCRSIEALPEVEARVLQKEVFIGIHCQKQKDILLKILSLLKNLHLSITNTSLLPFGTSTFKITIISQMNDEYNMTLDDLVKALRQHLLKSRDIQE